MISDLLRSLGLELLGCFRVAYYRKHFLVLFSDFVVEDDEN